MGLVGMSALKKLIQMIFIAGLVVIFSYLNQLSNEQSLHGKQRLRKHEKIFLNAPPRPLPDRHGSIARIQGSLNAAASSLSSYFHPGVRKPLGSTYSRVMVIPRLKSDNISWVSDELPNVDTVFYIANDPLAALHPPKNKGHEVMIYLSYIIDHYDALPDIIIFMHAHRWTHHNNPSLSYDAAEMVRRLNGDYVTKEGYVNMRCHWAPGCPEWLHSGDIRESIQKQEELLLSRSWKELFPLDPLPNALGQACCAQFALSKERVLSIPLSRFIFYRDWIMKTPLSDYISGRIWEYSWQYLFKGQSILCPAEHICYCGAFGICFGGALEYREFEDLHQRKKSLEVEMQQLSVQRGQRDNTFAIRYAYLNNSITSLEQETTLRKEDALRRGLDPKNRAKECEVWSEVE